MDKQVFSWRTQSLGGSPTQIFQPQEAPEAAAIWLHDWDGATFRGREAFETALAREKLVVVCPMTGPNWWLDQPAPGGLEPTPMQFVKDQVVAWITQEWGFQPPLIGLCGTGMGGQGAVNLAFRAARRFPVVAALSPDLDFHQWHGQGTLLDTMFPSREAARQQTAILHLHPLNWPRDMLLACDPQDSACFEGAERLASKLASTGIPFEADFETTGGGHSWEYFDRLATRTASFLGDRLRRQKPTAG